MSGERQKQESRTYKSERNTEEKWTLSADAISEISEEKNRDDGRQK